MLRICLLVITLLFSPFSAYADYRPNHGGWAHGHDCEGCKLDNCRHHHHTVSKYGIRLGVIRLLHKAVVELHNKFEFTNRWIPDHRYRELKETLIKYFSENQKELLERIPKELGNAVGTCDYSPPKETEELWHSEEECEAFKAGKPQPPAVPSNERVPRPNFEDYIENSLEKQRPDKI